MKASQNAIDLIKEFEGLRLMPYNCPAGHATIGYGHKMHDGPVTSQDKIKYHGFDADDAEALLMGDVQWMDNDLGRRIGKCPMNQNQYDALASLHFNIPSAFASGTGINAAIASADMARIPQEMARWINVSGKPSNGLKRRRAAEARLFMQEPV